MRPYLLSLLLVSAAAPLAHADTFQLTFNGTYVPQPMGTMLGPGPDLSFSWQISAPPVFYLYDGQYPAYEFPSVPVTGADFAGTFNLGIDANTVNFFTIDDFPYDVYGIAFLSTQTPFSTGPDSNPIFLPGTYYGADFDYNVYSDYTGTFIVADLSTGTTPTPEPSTLLLLGTGLASAAQLLRRRSTT